MLVFWQNRRGKVLHPHRYFIIAQIVAIERTSDTEFDKISGTSRIKHPWRSQRVIPTESMTGIIRETSRDSFSLTMRTIWGIELQEVRSAARYPMKV